jgi:hypothetical protein
MPTQLTAEHARESLNAHVAAKGREIHEKFGPHIGWEELMRIIQDRASVRYPCEIVFDTSGLQPGEFAHPVARAERPEDGFILYVHPHFQTQLEQVPLLILYQLVLVNYGEFATSDDAEAFGAAALGWSREDYYHALCALADELERSCGPQTSKA